MDEAANRRRFLVLALLWLAGIALFLPLVRNGFIGDDYTALSIYRAYKAKPFLETVLYGGNDFFRPLNMALIMARGALFGANPLPYVIANILLHLVITTLVFLTAGRITRNLRAAAAAAFLFLVSFSHYEGITWISSSVELFAVFFIMISLYSHVRFRQDGKKVWLAFSLAAMVLSFLTKETSAALPFLILAYDLVFVGRKERARGFFRPYLGYGLCFALYLVVQTGWAMKYVGGDSPYRFGWHILVNVFDYWVWLIMPNPRHPYVAGILKMLPPPLLIAYWILSAAAALTLPLAAALAFLRKLSRPLLWSFLATLIALAVFLPFAIKISARYAYLPSVCFSIFAAGSFAWLWELFRARGGIIYNLRATRGEGVSTNEGRGEEKKAGVTHSHGVGRAWLWITAVCGVLYLSANAAATLLVEREFVKTSSATRRLADEVANAAPYSGQDVVFIDGLPAHVHLREAVDWITGKDLEVLASNDAYRGTPRDVETVRRKYAGSASLLYYFKFQGDSLTLIAKEKFPKSPQ